jgi:hypothetical protein
MHPEWPGQPETLPVRPLPIVIPGRVAPDDQPVPDVRPRPRPRPKPDLQPEHPFPITLPPEEQPLVIDPVRSPIGPAEPAPRLEFDVKPKPGARSEFTRFPPMHRAAPPGRRTKEKKLVVRAGATFLRVVNATTEGLDFFKSFYDALPDRYKSNYRYSKKLGKWVPIFKSNHPHRQRDLYQNWDKVDFEQAFKNLAMNELEDRFWGKQGQFMQRQRRQFLTPDGVDLGPGGRGLEFGPAL